jgi:hypothetical protein
MKMQQIIMVVSIFLLCSNNASAQINDEAQSVLWKLEKKYFQATNEVIRSTIAYEKALTYLKFHAEADSQCYNEFKRVDAHLFGEKKRCQFLWNAAMVYLIHDDFVESMRSMQAYQLQTGDTTVQANLLAVMSFLNAFSEENDSLFIAHNMESMFQCLLAEKDFERRRDRGYAYASYVMPGVGMMLKGYYLQGTTSLLLNVGSGALVYSLIRKHAYGNALGYALLTIFKFYQGNVMYTKKLVSKRRIKKRIGQMQTCHQQLQALLMAYPIQFKE